MKKLVDLIHMQTRPTDLDQLRTCLSSQFNVNKYELDQQLLFLKSAHPILIALKERGVHQLVQTLDEAEEPALNAFNQLTMNQPLNKLVKLFLINNTKELEQARGLLIDLVRQPDLSTILNQQLDSIARDAIKTMSQRYLLLALEKPTCELQKIIALRHFLTENPFIIQTEVLWIINELYTDELNKDLYSPISHAYITLIYDLLISMNLSQQRELIRTINQKSLLLIIQYSLKGMTDDALSQQHMCTHLLRLLCTNASIRDRASQRLITATLNQPDSYLFDQTPPLAKSNANWLFTLLTSPDYIATCSVRTLKRLSDRYKISSFWEKQSSNPARFTHIIEQQSYLGKQIKSSINQIVEFHSTHQEAEQKTLIKKEKIAQFTTNIELTELFLQLEQKCQPENRNHQKALIKLYSYYQQSHSMLRADLLFRAIDYAYSSIRMNQGSYNGSVIFSWLALYPFPVPFDKEVCSHKKEVILHLSEGTELACLNENNEAITFVNHEPVLLVETSAITVGDSVYDKEKKLIGTITASGYLKSANPSQKMLCAHLLAAVPIRELEQSPEGLNLLLDRVLFENTLNELYNNRYLTQDHKKPIWLERHISNRVTQSAKAYDPTTVNALIIHLSQDSVFHLLAHIQCRTNALYLFHEIINQKSLREHLFSGYFESDLQQFLIKNDAAYCLADYMAHYYDKPWFTQGLTRFAFFVSKNKQYTVLGDALTFLKEEAKNNQQKSNALNLILYRLLSTEETATLVLKEFLHDPAQITVQQAESPEIKKVTAYFTQTHLIKTIHELNKKSNWSESAQYNLTLHLLNSQHDKLFEHKESTNSSSVRWKAQDLNELGCFVSRHLRKKRTLDPQKKIGYRLLGELLFRNAFLGQTSLFYYKKAINQVTVNLGINYPYLIALASKFKISDAMTELNSADPKELLNTSIPLGKELEDQKTLQAWRLFVNQIGKDNEKKKLPLICVYLFNYIGPKKPLAILLINYFKQHVSNPEALHPIARLLQLFPQREMCAVLFDTLVMTAIKIPTILDKNILSYMAQYYAYLNNKSVSLPEMQLDLILFFGQNKHYDIAKKSCDDLASDCNDPLLKKRLLKGSQEARVEKYLSKHLDRFYFELIKVINRWWYYGFNTAKNRSDLIKFCDNKSKGPAYKHAGTMINNEEQGSSPLLSFKERKKQLINLLSQINQAQPKNVIGVTGYSLFETDNRSNLNKHSTETREAVILDR